MWYHTLNVEFRTRISGETDFPSVYGERVGLGRSYMQLEGALDYERWIEGIRQGRAYVSDGRSHVMDFRARAFATGDGDGVLRLAGPDTIRLTENVAARLPDRPEPDLSATPIDQQPSWHLERARIGEPRNVAVEVVKNGEPVARRELLANGHVEEVVFEVPFEHSGWVALRTLHSSHTNPIFVEVAGRPSRASAKSVE